MNKNFRGNLPKKVVAIGASSCFGIGDPAGGGFIGRFKSWYEQENLDSHARVYNLGIPGDTIDDICKRISEVDLRCPDLVIIQSGANDCTRSESAAQNCKTSLADFKDNFEKLLNNLNAYTLIYISNYPNNEMYTLPVGDSKYYYKLSDILEYSNAALEIAQKHKIQIVNILEDWLNKDYELFLSDDGLHANANGHEYIFQKLRDKFLSKYDIQINLTKHNV